jgi:type IV secretory pathway TrbD component
MRERRTVLHQSLTRPVLWAGAQRGPALVLWTTVVLLVFPPPHHWLTLSLGVALGIGGHLLLVRMAKTDPHWWAVYRRSLAYQDSYPATPGSPHRRTRRTLP